MIFYVNAHPSASQNLERRKPSSDFLKTKFLSMVPFRYLNTCLASFKCTWVCLDIVTVSSQYSRDRVWRLPLCKPDFQQFFCVTFGWLWVILSNFNSTYFTWSWYGLSIFHVDLWKHFLNILCLVNFNYTFFTIEFKGKEHGNCPKSFISNLLARFSLTLNSVVVELEATMKSSTHMSGIAWGCVSCSHTRYECITEFQFRLFCFKPYKHFLSL